MLSEVETSWRAWLQTGARRLLNFNKHGFPMYLARNILAALVLLASAPMSAITSDTTFELDIPGQFGNVRFVGEAFPDAMVTFTRNGTVVGTTTADGGSAFDKTLLSQDLGSADYGIFATDSANRNTATVTYNINVLPNTTVITSGILLPPTFAVIRNPIKRPQLQSNLGVGRHNSTVTIFYSGSKYGDNWSISTGSNAAGSWGPATLNQTLHLGTYTTRAVLQTPSSAISPSTQIITFQVLLSADLNNDNRVNLTDFSILMFFYNQNTTKPADINDDGRVNLTDFSVMLFHWTG
jgi:hypothetical protein